MAFGDEFISMFNPSGGYGSDSTFGTGGGMDFTIPTADINFVSSGPYTDFGSVLGNQFQVQPDLSQYWTQQAPSVSDEEYAYGMIPQTNLGDTTGLVAQAPQEQWYDKLLSSPDAMVKLGLGGLGVLGNTLNSMQTNKMNKKAMKQNAKIQAYQAAAMDRAQKNAAIADRYNNSYDTTTAATPSYTPLTREQAMTYGETGAPLQQYSLTPGVTTRNYLAEGGFAHGGQADTVHAMLSEGEFVIPADVVSILGDGNTRAGGSALMQMMEQIRAGAGRSNTKSIPTKAKPATAYLKKGKK